MTTVKLTRGRAFAAILSLFVVSTMLFATAAVPTEDGGDDATATQSGMVAGSFAGARHQNPAGCAALGVNGMDALISPTKIRVKRGDTGAVIGTFTLPAFPADFSEGDIIEILEMEVTNYGCDISGADLIVAIYADGSGIPGTAVASKVVATGQTILNGQTKIYTPNWSYTVKPADHDVGYLVGGNPPGDQMAILGIIDAGLDPGTNLAALGECGFSGGTLHNAENESGIGCSVSLTLLTINEPAISVKKRAFLWNGDLPKVWFLNGAIHVNGKFLKDRKAIVAPGTEVHYLYQVVNIGPVNDLTPTTSVGDNRCQPLTPAQDTNGVLIGDDANDGELDVGEAWFYICAEILNLPDGEPFVVVKNTATFVYQDRNGNLTDPTVDDFRLSVGYKCKGKLATIVGTNGNDVLSGTSGADVIVGFRGKDVINSGGGNDIVCAGGGADEVDGGAGNDKIFGQGGPDELSGGDGKDRIKGGGGNDSMFGGSGDDNLNGQKGTDSANGNAGIDTCRAESKTSCEL